MGESQENYVLECEAFARVAAEVLPTYQQFVETMVSGLKQLELNQLQSSESKAEKPAREKTVVSTSIDLSSKNILIADDAELNRVLLGRELNRFGATLEFSAGGEDALQKCRNQKFSMIILGGSVIESVAAIRELHPAVPVFTVDPTQSRAELVSSVSKNLLA